MAAPMESEKTDEELVGEHRRGNPEAFEVLVERYRAYAYRVCYRMLGNHHAAEDSSQEAFVRAFRGLASYRGEAPFKTWFTRIMANECLSRKASMTRDPRFASELPEAPATPHSPQVELTELQAKVQAAVASPV